MKPPKKGRPRIENRANTIEAKKPWLKLNMSRQTKPRNEKGRDHSRPFSCVAPTTSPPSLRREATQRARPAVRRQICRVDAGVRAFLFRFAGYLTSSP